MMKEVLDTMPKKVADPSKKYTASSGKEYYESQKKHTEAFEKTQEKIIVRVPEGSRDVITEYVEQKAAEDPTNLKYSSYNGKAYRPSVNALIKALLEEELGRTLD